MGTREEEPSRTTVSGEKPTSTRTCSTCNLSVPNTVDVCPNDGTRLTAGVREGDKLLGKYTFLEVIGEGGMSVVYKARHPDLNKILAVKMLHSHLLNGPQAAGRFWQEAKAASALSHKNVIAVHDYGTNDGQQFMVMDFLDGSDLSKTIKAKGPLPLAEAVDVFIQICDGLQHAHTHGVVHRDLKPSNIVLTRGDEGQTVPKIVDFGIAKVIAEGGDENSQGYTKTGELLGSPPYMSPEQCKGTGLDARSDIYSIGCLMFEALTGKPPFDGSNFMEILFKHINDGPPTLKSANPSLNFPPKLEAILAKCLAKARSDRYQTAAELRTDLQKLQTAINNGSAFSESSISKKAIIVAATVCGVIAIGGAVFLNSTQKPAPPPPARAIVSSADVAGSDDEGQPADALTALAVEQSPNVTEFNCNTPAYSDKSLVYIAKLKKLETLNLEHSKISTQGLQALSKSTAPIHTLNLDKTYTRSEALKYLTKFPIEKLDIQDTLVDDAGGKYVAQMKRLVDLQIARDNVTDAFVADLVGLKFLSTVDFDQTKITNKSLQYFAKIASMKDLDVCRTEVNDKGLPALAPLENLEELHLKNCVLGAGALKNLPTLPRLSALDLNDTGINDEDVAQLSRFKKLQKLDLEGNLVSDASIATLIGLPQLHELHLSRTLVTPKGLKKLAQCKSLEKLYTGGIQMTQSERDALKQSMPNVKLEST